VPSARLDGRDVAMRDEPGHLRRADRRAEASAAFHRGRGGTLRSVLPRIESTLLILGLVCTVYGKAVALRPYGAAGLVGLTASVAVPDLVFFAGVALLIRCLYTVRPSPFCARCALVIAACVAVWSALNTCWLMTAGVQLQPGILALFVNDFNDIWPLARAHLLQGLVRIISLAAGALVIGGLFVWAFLRPAKVHNSRRHHLRVAVVLGIVVVGLLLARGPLRPSVPPSFTAEVLDFSSHWYALECVLGGFGRQSYPLCHSPNIYLAGAREITAPSGPAEELPNVVLILLEGVSHSVTSLSGRLGQTTPTLARLAAEGVEFRTTRVPVPYTNKAYWATLTGTVPVIATDEVEAVPVAKPYEGLPTILKRVGYRAGFFEMSKGNFECAPGFFSNLGFDWAWFRENLEDPSAYVGYLGGDDCWLIEPAIEWAKQEDGPFLLMMITSVAHDPFDVPEWFEEPAEGIYEKYIQTIRFTDYFLGQFCGRLREEKLDGNTILCVIGDHGTSFRTRRQKGRWIPYEEVIRVPWVISWPGHLEPGQVIEWPCSQLDVTPTILSLVGFGIERADFDGRDALQRPDGVRRFYFSSLLANSPAGFVEQDTKIVYWPYIEKVFRYDLVADPNEENPTLIPSPRKEAIIEDIRRWESKSQIAVDVKRHTKRFLFSHWQVFSIGRSAWAYYVP